MRNITNWNIKDMIEYLLENISCIQSIYLFGSRAYQTKSLRSDIDILLISDEPISFSEFIDIMHDKFPPLDVFYSTDNKNAVSAINNSVLKTKDKTTLVEQVEAILLWNRENQYNTEFNQWEQKALTSFNFQMSVIPSAVPDDEEFHRQRLFESLDNKEVKTYFAGSTWKEISESIIIIIKTAFKIPSKYSKKAKSFSFENLKLSTEYDFQNFIHLLLRPIFPSIEPENLMITIDGAEKNADFGINNNSIVIETKHIKDISSKATVLKTLEGLSDFYKHNCNVKCLIFLILYNNDVELDDVRLKNEYDRRNNEIPIFVEFIKNQYT